MCVKSEIEEDKLVASHTPMMSLNKEQYVLITCEDSVVSLCSLYHVLLLLSHSSRAVDLPIRISYSLVDAKKILTK